MVGIRARPLSDDDAQALMVALRAGSTLVPFSLSGNAPVFKAYCAAHPVYAEEALPLLAANLKASNRRRALRPHREKTHCKRGHLMTPENTYRRVSGQTQCITCRKERLPYRKERLRELQTESGIKPRPPSSSKFANQSNGRLNGCLPNYNFPKIKFCQRGHAIVGENIYLTNHTILCRICTKISWRLTRTNGNLREATVRRVLLELQEGKVISEIADTGRLKFFCSANPKLGERIEALAEKNRVTSFKQKIERNRRAAAPVLFRNNGRDVFQAIRRATASIGEWERGDVMSLMFIAVAENRLNLADADDRMEEFVKVHRRRPRVYGESSLDKPVSFDSSATLLDMLSTESGSWDVNMMASTGRRK